MSVPLTCILVALAAVAEEPQGGGKPDRYPRTDLLIEATELAKPAISGRFRVLDARGKEKYLAGHIPRATWVAHDTWSKAFAEGQDKKAWAKRIGGLGIERDTPVVVYDDNSAKDAARIWWILRYWGIKEVRLLNGGWPMWQEAVGKIETDEIKFPVLDVKLTAQGGRLATKEELLEALKTRRSQIVDARSEGEYCGTEKTAKRNGAIPGAIHLEWVEVIDKKSKCFKSPEELSKLFHDKTIDLGRPSVTHCQSGGRAAVMAFALELMGAKQVQNYYKSWAEWGNADDTPIEKPKK